MDDATFTSASGAAAMNRHSLLEQLAIIRSLFRKERSADDDAAATAAARNRNVVEGRAKEGVRLINDQMAAVSTELLLTVMSDMMLLRLLDVDGLGLEERRAVASSSSVGASDQQLALMDDAAATTAKKKKRAAAAAAKKKRYKRNKAAAKNKDKKSKLMSWGDGLIALIMVIAFGSSFTTLIFPLSLIHQCDGSGEGGAPPALPPSASASKSLRQKDHRLNYDESVSSDIDIISPLPAVAVVPLSILSPTDVAVGDRRMKSDELRDSACVDTPGWKDKLSLVCNVYENYEKPGCLGTDQMAGDMGPASEHCCFCEGGSHTCEDYRSKCQKYINVEGLGFKDGFLAPLCKEAESCSCEGVDHDFEIVTDSFSNSETLGLYNECKCDFWSRLCEDKGGAACDYAAEYCCGDYGYWEFTGTGEFGFIYLNSPACYCDFYNYAQNEFGHMLKPKALKISEEFKNPCGQIEIWLKYGDSNDERTSLEAFYEGTNGQNWTNNAGWMDDTAAEDYCQWYGISCGDEGLVTGIDLRDNNLAGQFPVYTRNITPSWDVPAPESDWKDTKYGLANLYNLKTLDLSDNKLTGTIEYRPLYNLASLTHFEVSGNQLSGEVDALVAPSLTHADFSNNRFTSMSRFKRYMGSSKTLSFCDMSNNVIQMNATDIFSNIPPNIQHFFASNNGIYGTLPESSINLPALRQLNISSNALSGELPDFAVSISSLQELDMSNQTNGLTGSIPENLWGFQSLKILNLAGNKLSKSIPPTIGDMTVLEELDLSSNSVSGQIPFQIGQLEGTLKHLDLSNNGLTGAIPSQLGQLQGASILLKGNRFDNKTAPLSLCLLRSVEYFDLAFDPTFCQSDRNALRDFYDSTKGANWTDRTNWLDGDEDEYAPYCDWKGVTCDDTSRVTELDLSNNGLSGRLSESIGNLTFIEVLDLSDNDIKGSIPTEIGLLSKLTDLRLSSNSFTGTAPLSLCMLRSVEAFDLAQDMTFCPIERNALLDFYDSTKGASWTDRTNWLDGDEDEYASYCDWKGVTCDDMNRVTELNLANNGLSGGLSESIGDLTFIEVLDLSDNDIKGSIPTEIGLLSKLTHLRLNSNSFNGPIPEDLGRFLKTMILAGNELTGLIPEDLGRFQSLKILNLAGNKLSGAIPPTIGDMTVLEVLELSSNSLSGQIPLQIGQLEGTLNSLDLSNNTLSGTIPSQIGQLQGASILLKDNLFEDKTAPLSLCMLHGVETFDLANDIKFCPIERNALSDFYDSAKGAEWTDRTNWLDGDEYESYCEWDGVTCNEKNRVTELKLANNGLSGRLSKSIGNLKFIEVLDLSDNDIKGSIPTEIGNLTNLTYLRLSYNAFTGAAPEGLGELAQLQLLQLQTNRITKIPNIPQLNESIYNRSTFVTDCGVPSAFDKALECTHCTMCCNANEDCYPQEDTQVAEWGFDYITFAAVLFAGFIAVCCIVALCIYLFSKRKNRGNALTTSTERRLEEDDKYALRRIGKSSVYSYFVTDKVLGWIVAFATLGIQIGILVFFVMASEANLQNDAIDIQFTWKCPRNSDVCKNKADLNKYGWGIFSMLMVANLAKDMISGSKLIYHSSKVRHPLGSRIRYFVGGTLLCSITLFALYVSTVYNMAIATSNTDIIVNSVIVLFVMDLDEWIFAALEACNEKWTKHAADSEDSSSDTEKGGAIDEMQDKIALQDAQIADQQKELMRQKIQIEQMARQFGQLTELQDGVQNMQDSQAGSSASFETVFYCDPNANESVTSNADAVEPEDAQLDADAREGGKMTMNGTKMRNHYRRIKLGIRRGRPSTPNASGSGYNRL